jgi:hypothetical protein
MPVNRALMPVKTGKNLEKPKKIAEKLWKSAFSH